MNCECNDNSNRVKPRIKHVYGNVLRMAIPLTLRTLVKDGDEMIVNDTDFIPSSDHLVRVVLSKGKTNYPITATMDGNVAIIEDKGKIPEGTYDISVECYDDLGNPYRFKQNAVLYVADTTAEAGIDEEIEYEAQTWYLNAAVFLATTEIGEIGDVIDAKLDDVFGNVMYDANAKEIRFYNKGNSRVLATLDSRPFVVDGTVADVYIDVSRQVLDVVLNEDAGGRRFSVPLYLVFNSYYKKDEVDSLVSRTVEGVRFDFSQELPLVVPVTKNGSSISSSIGFGAIVNAIREDGRLVVACVNNAKFYQLLADIGMEVEFSRVVALDGYQELLIVDESNVWSMEDVDLGTGGGGGGYEPPIGGIPKTDLAQSVQDTLDDVSNKVDKVAGKGLSTEDYTTAEKQKLAGLSNYDDTEIQAEVDAKYEKPSTGIPKTDLASGVQTSLGKADTALQAADKTQLQAAINAVQTALNNLMNGASVTDAIDTFNEVVDFLNDIDTDDPTLFNQLKSLSDAITALQTALAGKISGIKANGASTTLPVDQNGIVELPPAGSTISPADTAPSMDGNTALVGSSAKYAREDHVHPHDSSKLSKSDVSVETQGDGTVSIRVSDDTYSINLNHTHEGMAKLVVDAAANLPDVSEMESDTIYAEIDDGEVAVLYVGGYPFYGGGGGANVPRLDSPRPNTTINLGDSINGVAASTILIKAKNLTTSLTAELVGTGFEFDSQQPSGVTLDQQTGKLTITAEAATAINGVNIAVKYTGSSNNAEGTLQIVSITDSISVQSTLIANDTTNVVANWLGSSAIFQGDWVEEVSWIHFDLSSAATKTNDGYQFNNLSAPKDAYALVPASSAATLNQKIDKEFTCYVNCMVKFAAAEKSAVIIDFGAFGDSASGISVGAFITTEGLLKGRFKTGGNSTAGFSDMVAQSQTGISFTLDTYTNISVKLGVRILDNGKQEVYIECGSGKCYAIIDTPVSVNFSGMNGGNPGQPIALGVGYIQSMYVQQLAANYLADVVYKQIKIKNIAE